MRPSLQQLADAGFADLAQRVEVCLAFSALRLDEQIDNFHRAFRLT
ncbi:hypothetical protein SAMN05216338_105762 [Bradyrhizobium sp. Rc2d]|nr:hypothetical protein SAMN05216338_105762 [Bradyrhizobium sp. Rc2d]